MRFKHKGRYVRIIEELKGYESPGYTYITYDNECAWMVLTSELEVVME